MPVTEYIHPTAELVQFVLDTLDRGGFQAIRFLGSTPPEQLSETFPDLRLPAAVLRLNSSLYENVPRMRVSFIIIMCVDPTSPDAQIILSEVTDSVISLLDGASLGDAVFHVRTVTPRNLDPGYLSSVLEFFADDH